jgi:hypothetical protein
MTSHLTCSSHKERTTRTFPPKILREQSYLPLRFEHVALLNLVAISSLELPGLPQILSNPEENPAMVANPSCSRSWNNPKLPKETFYPSLTLNQRWQLMFQDLETFYTSLLVSTRCYYLEGIHGIHATLVLLMCCWATFL